MVGALILALCMPRWFGVKLQQLLRQSLQTLVWSQQIDSAQALQAIAAVRWDAPTQAEAPEKTDPQPA